MKLNFLSVLCLPLLAACANPILILQNQIKKNGYIIYRTPLEQAGTGTLVGGKPNAMSIVAHPQTCFPDTAPGEPALRRVDNAAVGNLNQTVSFSGNIKVDLLNFMGNANSMFKIKAGFDAVQQVDLQVKGAKVEYMDAIVLQDYYNNRVSAICKDYLNSVAFIVQALRFDEMTFSFKSSNGAYIELTADAIKQIVDIGLDVKYRVDQKYFLTFETPKYIGYQLGRLQKTDQGVSLYRASKVIANIYQFKSIAIFDEPSETPPSNGGIGPFVLQGARSFFQGPAITDFAPLTQENLIDPYSVYRD